MTGSNRVILGPSSFASVDPSPVERLKAAGLEVVANPYGRKLTKEEMLGLLPGAVGLIAGLERLNGEVLEHSTLKVISRCGAGLSNIDLHVARVLGIEVRSTPDAMYSSKNRWSHRPTKLTRWPDERKKQKKR